LAIEIRVWRHLLFHREGKVRRSRDNPEATIVAPSDRVRLRLPSDVLEKLHAPISPGAQSFRARLLRWLRSDSELAPARKKQRRTLLLLIALAFDFGRCAPARDLSELNVLFSTYARNAWIITSA
jgi:hypothetical protein